MVETLLHSLQWWINMNNGWKCELDLSRHAHIHAFLGPINIFAKLERFFVKLYFFLVYMTKTQTNSAYCTIYKNQWFDVDSTFESFAHTVWKFNARHQFIGNAHKFGKLFPFVLQWLIKTWTNNVETWHFLSIFQREIEPKERKCALFSFFRMHINGTSCNEVRTASVP